MLRTEQPRGGHVLLVAPAGKCDHRVLQGVVDSIVAATRDRRPTAVVDCFAGRVFEAGQDPTPIREWASAEVDGQTLLLDGWTWERQPPDLVRHVADVLEATLALRQSGVHVVLLGPWLLDETVWLFRLAAQEVADDLLVVGDEYELGDWMWPAVYALLGRDGWGERDPHAGVVRYVGQGGPGEPKARARLRGLVGYEHDVGKVDGDDVGAFPVGVAALLGLPELCP